MSSVTRVGPSEATRVRRAGPSPRPSSRSPGFAQPSENVPSTSVSTRQSAPVVRTVAPCTGAPDASRTTPVTAAAGIGRRDVRAGQTTRHHEAEKGCHNARSYLRRRGAVSPRRPAARWPHGEGDAGWTAAPQCADPPPGRQARPPCRRRPAARRSHRQFALRGSHRTARTASDTSTCGEPAGEQLSAAVGGTSAAFTCCDAVASTTAVRPGGTHQAPPADWTIAGTYGRAGVTLPAPCDERDNSQRADSGARRQSGDQHQNQESGEPVASLRTQAGRRGATTAPPASMRSKPSRSQAV